MQHILTFQKRHSEKVNTFAEKINKMKQLNIKIFDTFPHQSTKWSIG